jgi:radical SAM-linked protein
MGAEPAVRSLIEVTYAKEGAVLFLAHLDVLRAFERAVRRADLPIAHSEGFNPRPRLVFASPLGVGQGGMEERCCLTLREAVAPLAVARALSAALPPGLRLVSAERLPGPKPPPYHTIEWAEWGIRIPEETAGFSPLSQWAEAHCLAERCARLLAATEALVTRRTKGGVREVDVRPGILELDAVDDRAVRAMLRLLEPSAKPAEVVEALGLPRGDAAVPHPIYVRLRFGPVGQRGALSV